MQKSNKLSTKKVTGLILAGGKNSRMGMNKAFIKFKNAEKLIETAVKIFKDLFQETIIATNEPDLYEYLGVTVISDLIPGKGPLSGIHAGLSKAETEYVFVVSCDMPFLNPALIELLVGEANGYDVVVPQFENYLEPLHAVYSKRCISYIEKSMEMDIIKAYGFYPWVKVKFVGEKKLEQVVDGSILKTVLCNINTLEDLEKAKKIAAGPHKKLLT